MRFRNALVNTFVAAAMATTGLAATTGVAVADSSPADSATVTAPPATCTGTKIAARQIIDRLPGEMERSVGRIRLFYNAANGTNCAQVVTSHPHIKLRVCLDVNQANPVTHCESVGSGRNWVATGQYRAVDTRVRARGWVHITTSAVGFGKIRWGHGG